MGSDPSVHNHLLAVYAKTRQIDKAIALVADMKKKQIWLDKYTYGTLLNACSKAEHPPYDLPKEFAVKAAHVFQDMRAAGLQPNDFHFHSLMDAQARAGLLEDAIQTFEHMKAQKLQPTTVTLNILVNACARAKQPRRALELVEHLQQTAGVQMNSTTWNTLLAAHARAGDMDGAYATWADMLRSQVVPTDITQRMLAQAFHGNSHLVTELLEEAAQARQQMLSDPQARRGAVAGPPAASLLILDLHGESVSSARAAILQRLQYFTTNLEDVLRERKPSENGFPTLASPEFQVITGAGKRSKTGHAQLREEALALLRDQGLNPMQDAKNPGRVAVSEGSLREYVRRRRRQRDLDRMFQYASWRTAALVASICSVAAAILLVPRLLSATS